MPAENTEYLDLLKKKKKKRKKKKRKENSNFLGRATIPQDVGMGGGDFRNRGKTPLWFCGKYKT